MVDGDGSVFREIHDVVVFEQQKIDQLTDERVVGQSGQHETPGKSLVNDLFYGIWAGHV